MSNREAVHALCPQSCGICSDIDANVPFGADVAASDELLKDDL